jgi:hypothetical protein
VAYSESTAIASMALVYRKTGPLKEESADASSPLLLGQGTDIIKNGSLLSGVGKIDEPDTFCGG